jgi:steroid 5-alpha reductase family enzyme
LLLLAYGLRLGGYLLLRDRAPGFRVRETNREPKQRNVSTVAKIGIWSGVATLYVLMALPVFVTLSAAARGMPLASLPYGVALMVIGLGLESVADRQKYRFKAAHPTRFCDTGLYHFVRCPNYLGEMLFWIGLWLSATAAYQGWLEWSLCSLGLATILGIMIGATRRLEGEQATHYGNDGGYATYRTSVPVLLPLLPLYTLRGSGSGRP